MIRRVVLGFLFLLFGGIESDSFIHYSPSSPPLNLTFINSLHLNCPVYCSEQIQYNSICINQGCKQWRIGLVEGCSFVCNGTEGNFREFHACQVGCSKLIEDYYYHVTNGLGVPSPPRLLSGTVGTHSVELGWDDGTGLLLRVPYLSFSIQRKGGGGGGGGEWETVPSPPINNTGVRVDGLRPYTEYQFRVGWVFAHDFPPSFSAPSSRIVTLPSGLPGPPSLSSLQPISNTSVSVSWAPPPDPNGPLVAYILKLQHLPHGHLIIKEIPIGQSAQRGYTFSSLLPNTNYSLDISAQNLEGEGDATHVTFLTPLTTISNDISNKRPEPRLLIQGAHDVYIQQMDLFQVPDVSVFISTQNVTGMSAHYRKKLVFISTSLNEIIRSNLDSNEPIVILSQDRLQMRVLFLSIDWLHDTLYIVGERDSRTSKNKGLGTSRTSRTSWTIKRCGLDGERLRTVVEEMGTKPSDFFADPVTGWLYWVSPVPGSTGDRAGLYKFDLNGESRGSKSGGGIVPMLEDRGLGPFTLDFINYRILIVHKIRNTVLSVSLDGESSDIREHTNAPQFTSATSLCTFGSLFLFPTGSTIVTEELNEAEGTYYHNSYSVPSSHAPIAKLLILHPSLQPTPGPRVSPRGLGVVFGGRRARVKYEEPPSIPGTGEGAWRDWKYGIRLSDNTSITGISGTEYVLNNLNPSTFYSIQVYAYSESGSSPLSPPFRGRTLRESSSNLSLLWASPSALLSTDPLGDSLSTLLTSAQWVNGGRSDGKSGGSLSSNSTIISLTLSPFSLFFSTSDGLLFSSSLSSSSSLCTKVKVQSTGVGSIAYEGLASKLYWATPREQRISRCGLKEGAGVSGFSCEKAEILPLVTLVEEMAVDSGRGVLVWSTGHTVEMSRLNGYEQNTIYSVGLFSGVRIVGFSLNREVGKMYWGTRDSWGSYIYSLVYGGKSLMSPEKILTLPNIPIRGPIRYFSDRLLWLQGPSTAVINDFISEKSSVLSLSSIVNISQVIIKEPSTLRLPKGKLVVIPNSVSPWTIVLNGSWDNFRLSWSPVNNTNYGRVYYELTLNDYSPLPTTNNYIDVKGGQFRPWTELRIRITSVTWYGSGEGTEVVKRSPAGRPSDPVNLRIYQHELEYPYVKRGVGGVISGELRWDPPKEPNGAILGYLISCYLNDTKIADCFQESDVEGQRVKINKMESGVEYSIGIQAYTEGGVGRMSRKLRVDTRYGNPLPTLLLSSGNKLQIFDIDSNSLTPIPSPSNPVTATYLASDETLFWFDDGQFLMKSKLDGSNKTIILSLNGTEGSSLKIDWIGRRLYWLSESISKSNKENNENDESKYGIWTYDLTSSAPPTPIIRLKYLPKSLAVDPFTSTLIWSTSNRHNLLTLYKCLSDGSSLRPFFSRDSSKCNCSSVGVVGETVSYDPIGSKGILFSGERGIWEADSEGCSCVLLINLTGRVSSPIALGSDAHHLYWSSRSSNGGNYLFASERRGNGITEIGTQEGNSALVREILLIGSSSQPFPPFECLIPSPSPPPPPPTLLNSSSSSLSLSLPPSHFLPCSPPLFSLLPTYTLYYAPLDSRGISLCTPLSSLEDIATHCTSVETTYSVFGPGFDTTPPVSPSVSTPSLHPSSPPPTSSPSFLPLSTSRVRSRVEIEIRDLNPWTAYSVFSVIRSWWGEREGVERVVSGGLMVRTGAGAPERPELERVVKRTPGSVEVVWKQPRRLNGERVWYEVEWRSSGSSSLKHLWADSASSSSSSSSNPSSNTSSHSLLLTSLLPYTNYSIWVVAYSEKGDSFSRSGVLNSTTLPPPSNLTLLGSTPHSMKLRWSEEGGGVKEFEICYREQWAADWNSTGIVKREGSGNGSYEFEIDNLRPRTVYGFRLKLWYLSSPSEPYIWPPESQFEFETPADKPGRPGTPLPRGIGKERYEVSWERAADNGAVVDSYALEVLSRNESGRKNSDKSSQISSNSIYETTGNEWRTVYNGSESRWEVRGLDEINEYSFRVRALNSYGWGEWSEESVPISLAHLIIRAESPPVGTTFIIVGIGICGTGALVLFFYFCRSKHDEKRAVSPSRSSEPRSVELATIRSLPGGSSFVSQSNILYVAELDTDLHGLDLPIIPRGGLSLLTLLGSGAFGDVYEGIAELGGVGGGDEVDSNTLSGGGGTRVAIKTLRKGASSKMKLEFIEEARLMSHIRHPHILQLLAISLDIEPCLVLELMSGGDLLSYLRSSRTTPHFPNGEMGPNGSNCVSLSMVDLVEMATHVASGCVYLEESHHVHRDLAARNCLVRLIEPQGGAPQQRIVKIGDFGLARDIYRSDYYRKEGDGWLPVRWMAPESLADGVFTTMSDVWAFGILLWEIMTRGHQPYPARSNTSVCSYVKNGGRPGEVPNCPHPLSALMFSCWEFLPQNRPNFKSCLSTLQSISQSYQAFNPNYNNNNELISSPPYENSDIYTLNSSTLPYASTQISQFSSGSNGGHVHSYTKYLTVLPPEDEEEHDYEIPLPLKPPKKIRKNYDKNSRKNYEDPNAIGLPSPPPYWNTGAFRISPPAKNYNFRHLLSSTSSGASTEDEVGEKIKFRTRSEIEGNDSEFREENVNYILRESSGNLQSKGEENSIFREDSRNFDSKYRGEEDLNYIFREDSRNFDLRGEESLNSGFREDSGNMQNLDSKFRGEDNVNYIFREDSENLELNSVFEEDSRTLESENFKFRGKDECGTNLNFRYDDEEEDDKNFNEESSPTVSSASEEFEFTTLRSCHFSSPRICVKAANSG